MILSDGDETSPVPLAGTPGPGPGDGDDVALGVEERREALRPPTPRWTEDGSAEDEDAARVEDVRLKIRFSLSLHPLSRDMTIYYVSSKTKNGFDYVSFPFRLDEVLLGRLSKCKTCR